MDENQIKEHLQALLNEEVLNYDRIVSLSNELAKQDPYSVRFSVDADLVSRLGNELVARQETALSELVKNAYDADATQVTLRFIDSLTKGGTLVIEDNGVGMTKEQLINGFMRISSGDKILHPISQNYHRSKAGQKGIGRFAVQRLGSKLEIKTRSESSQEGYSVYFDWSEYQRNKELTEIKNTISIIQQNKQGTILTIKGLRDKWNEKAIERMYRYLLGILRPDFFGLNKGNRGQDPGMEIKAYLQISGENKQIEVKSPNIGNFAIATIEGYVDENGHATYNVDSKKLLMHMTGNLSMDPDKEGVDFNLIRNVRLKAYHFLNDYFPRDQKLSLQNFLKENGGIRLYRNGYRVLPYAESGDDWLSLDASLKRNSILPQHGNQNFYGIIEIELNSGEFEETSSREGMLGNDTFIQLKNFAYRVLLTAIIAIGQVRNVKIRTGQKKDEDGNWEIIDLRVRNIAYTIDEIDKALGQSTVISPGVKESGHQAIKNVKREIKKLRQLQKEIQKRSLEEKVRLRVLSSVGLSTEQFVHEIKYYLHNMSDDMSYLKEQNYPDKKVMERIMILDENFSNFKTYVSYMDTAVANNVNRELRPIELREVVNPFVKNLKNDAQMSGIKMMTPEFMGYNLYTKAMHPSEWLSILFNFYTNSKKAIKRAMRKEGIIGIACGKENGVVYLEFSDNGDGISKENEERIFNEFFTTSSPRNFADLNQVNEITGSGLGLTIVKDIVESYQGDVKVVNPKGDFETCIRVEIPALSDRDILKLF